MTWAERPVGMEAPGHDIRGGEIEAVLDQVALLTSSVGTIVNRTTTLTLTTATHTAITFPNIEGDNMSNFVSGGSVITVSRAGMYIVSASGLMNANATGLRQIVTRRNGTDIPAGGDGKAGTTVMNCRLTVSIGVSCNAGDTIDVRAYQDSGGNLDLTEARLSVLWQGDLS